MFFHVQVLAIPAVPLTMSAGLLFGTLYGTVLVSIAGTVCINNQISIHALSLLCLQPIILLVDLVTSIAFHSMSD